MIIAYLPILFALLGLLMYILASNPKVVEIGRVTFMCGLFVSLWPLMSKVLKLP